MNTLNAIDVTIKDSVISECIKYGVKATVTKKLTLNNNWVVGVYQRNLGDDLLEA